MNRATIGAILLLSLGCLSKPSDALAMAELAPRGITHRLTEEGWIWVDSRGMTLYVTSMDAKPGESHCTSTRRPYEGASTSIPQRSPDTRPACIDKNPPLSVAAGSHPIDKWTVVTREDGTKQWAYSGHPLYTSIRDKRPGDLNGIITIGSLKSIWNFARAPIPGAPSGIVLQKVPAGLVFAGAGGKLLYTFSPEKVRGKSKCDERCVQIWKPLAAPAAGSGYVNADWSIVAREDGSKQWAYQGKRLYTYKGDTGVDGGGVHDGALEVSNNVAESVEGWRVVLLKAAPSKYPAEVTVQSTIAGKLYADQRGRTLYTYRNCFEGIDGQQYVTCNDSGDSSVDWFRDCGGPQRCAETWYPLVAPKNAKAIGNEWSVVTINPSNPLAAVIKPNEGISVWAYRGMPVFTFARDPAPGYLNGTDGVGTYWDCIPLYGQALPYAT